MFEKTQQRTPLSCGFLRCRLRRRGWRGRVYGHRRWRGCGFGGLLGRCLLRLWRGLDRLDAFNHRDRALQLRRQRLHGFGGHRCCFCHCLHRRYGARWGGWCRRGRQTDIGHRQLYRFRGFGWCGFISWCWYDLRRLPYWIGEHPSQYGDQQHNSDGNPTNHRLSRRPCRYKAFPFPRPKRSVHVAVQPMSLMMCRPSGRRGVAPFVPAGLRPSPRPGGPQ